MPSRRAQTPPLATPPATPEPAATTANTPTPTTTPGDVDAGLPGTTPARAAYPQPSRVQMADIARLAGVSVSTVSRALADSPLVNAETRTRVAELARSLNYTINVGAQNLRLKQNRTVAVIVPYDPETRQHLSDPFFLSLIGSLADALTDRGHDMLLTRVDAGHLDQAAAPWRTGRASGIVLVGQWHHHDQLNAMAVQGVPFMVWGAQMPQQLYATVGSDNLGGGELATAHLFAQGARKVVFMGDPDLPEIGQRQAGWQRAHTRVGRTADPRLARKVPFVAEDVRQAVEQLVREGLEFDAVFAASDLMAMTIIGTLQRLGRRVPEDVRVVGYDDIALAAHFEPPITTIRQPIEEAGVMLVEGLLGQLAGERVDSRQLRTELVVRRSSS